MRIRGQIIDIENQRIYKGEVEVAGGKIISITALDEAPDHYILPGFIDAHVHIESSMMVPSEFARMAVVHGTVATVSDPHEIANVLGVRGVEYMIRNGRQTPFKFYFGAPSCVPATPFETAGAVVSTADIRQLMEMDEILYLAEMMNWPGVLNGDPEVRARIEVALAHGKVVDGHAPGLKGAQAKAYASAGITTDHECFTEEEALDKLKNGMKIIIREGSAAKNFEALIGLLNDYPEKIMFCSDDKHPDSLEDGHINELVKRALAKGVGLFKVLQAACINPVLHYGLNVGRLRINDCADFIVVKDLDSFEVLQTFIDGTLVAERGRTLIPGTENQIVNNFHAEPTKASDFHINSQPGNIRIIEVLDGQLITNEVIEHPSTVGGKVVPDVKRDILKIAVVNRYHHAAPATAFVKKFGLKRGAVASSVGHDSHNIIAVGVDDDAIARAVNLVIDAKGGVSAVDGERSMLLPLPVAGIMSPDDGYEIARKYKAIDQMSREMGSTLNAPFMTLSFLALLVIPSIKLSDKGLFDGNRFRFVDLFVQ